MGSNSLIHPTNLQGRYPSFQHLEHSGAQVSRCRKQGFGIIIFSPRFSPFKHRRKFNLGGGGVEDFFFELVEGIVGCVRLFLVEKFVEVGGVRGKGER